MRILALAALACLLCACTAPMTYESGVVQSTSRHSSAEDDWYRDIVYVRVATGAPDAVLYAEASQWADVVALLEFGQWLRVIDRPTGNYLPVQTVGHDVNTEGWIWNPAVQSRMPRGYPPGEEKWENEGADLEFRSNRNAYSTGPYPIEPVDVHEEALKKMAGDSETLLRRFRDFGQAGGLTGE